MYLVMLDTLTYLPYLLPDITTSTLSTTNSSVYLSSILTQPVL